MKLATTLLVFCIGALLSLGMVMLYSAGMMKGTDGAQYFLKQLACCGVGVLACCVVASLDYQVFKKLAWVLFGLSIILLVLVLIPNIGYKTGGARRWLRWHGTTLQMQPSELAKLALIVVLAWYGDRFQGRMKTFTRGVILPGCLIGLTLGLIFLEPDVGTTMLLAAVSAALLLIAGIRWLHFLPPVTALIAAFVLFLVNDPMRSSRIYSWLHLEETKQEKGLQAWQARVAFGSGGWEGLGLGNGRQKLGFVPEHHTDFIFSIIGEELGLIATLSVIAVFIMFVCCGFYISLQARELFGVLLGAGITLIIGFQAFINIGVVTGTLPNKGLPLPFISYGGTNLVLTLTSVGILLSIARHAHERRRAGEEDLEAFSSQNAAVTSIS
jgi:cell division protein FtsW